LADEMVMAVIQLKDIYSLKVAKP